MSPQLPHEQTSEPELTQELLGMDEALTTLKQSFNVELARELQQMQEAVNTLREAVRASRHASYRSAR